MSKNNLIKKSDKKFIRREKARIRAAVLDTKKQEEAIKDLYNKFIGNKTNAKISADKQKIKNNLNPKSEFQNPKQIQKSKSETVKKDKKLKVKNKAKE